MVRTRYLPQKGAERVSFVALSFKRLGSEEGNNKWKPRLYIPVEGMSIAQAFVIAGTIAEQACRGELGDPHAKDRDMLRERRCELVAEIVNLNLSQGVVARPGQPIPPSAAPPAAPPVPQPVPPPAAPPAASWEQLLGPCSLARAAPVVIDDDSDDATFDPNEDDENGEEEEAEQESDDLDDDDPDGRLPPRID